MRRRELKIPANILGTIFCPVHGEAPLVSTETGVICLRCKVDAMPTIDRTVERGALGKLTTIVPEKGDA
jgi:hypothetical protein